MTRIPYIACFTLTALTASGLALAQDPQSPAPNPQTSVQPAAPPQNSNSNRGWRRVDEPAPADPAATPQADPGTPMQSPPPAPPQSPRYYSGQPAPPPGYDPNQGPPPNYQQGPPPNYQQGPPPNYQQGPSANYQQGPQAQHPPLPATLTIKSGTYVTVHVNQVLSSDHNHPGDAFAATLVRPIVVDGIVVAERGQTFGGRVAEAKKAGMVEGTSKLGVQLTDLTLADGQNLPITSQLISRDGPTSVGRDVGAVAGTTALGAAAGAAADWGRGAAIGAGAGAAVGLIGVLLTRGEPTILHPEQTLTFKLQAPVTVATDHAPQAFRYVEPGDYQQNELQHRGPAPTMRVGGPPPPYYYGGAPAPYYYAPYPYYYYGPSVGFYYGGRYYRGWHR
jgi:hypothetical protein